MKYNKENLKKYIEIKFQLEMIKNSNLYLTNLDDYIKQTINYCCQLQTLKF